jgi:hypothetical protein
MTPSEEYALFIEQVNKLAERRQNITTIYLSVNAAIATALTLLFRDGYMSDWPQQASALLLFAAGIVVCDLWRRLLIQYRTLLSWWYKRLHVLEDTMPQSSKLIKLEYEELYQKRRERPHIGLTRYETALTWVFTGLYTAFALSIVITWLVF